MLERTLMVMFLRAKVSVSVGSAVRLKSIYRWQMGQCGIMAGVGVLLMMHACERALMHASCRY